MLNKNDLLDALTREIDLTRHLMTKVEGERLNYRPTEGQRTTLELLRYLSFCGLGGSMAMADGNWDRYKELAAKSETLTAEQIPGALDEQERELRAFYGELTDDQFANQEATTPLGEKLSLGRALLEAPVKWMTAYRMQLFLYAKAAGDASLSTYNCWGGMDKPAE